MKYLIVLYLIAVSVLSLTAFGLFGWDKRRARRGGQRIPERTLHMVSVLGGWPGAMAGQRIFRHKTQKLSFRIVFWTGILLHVGVVIAVGYVLSG
jgi:uncharacterized membrane protein YsdA (DUF1294 family)